jgi:DNA polymerase III alpha subunit
MKEFTGDVDIDLCNRNEILNKIVHVPATIIKENGSYEKHKVGVYVQDIPFDPKDATANIDYKFAQKYGFFKIDFLNVSIYEKIKSESHIANLINLEPKWELLQHEDFVKELFHISNYANLLKKLKPDSTEKLAAVLALIRPAKKHLINETWDVILREVWKRPENNEYYFKRSHAISYSVAIIVQMNLICEELNFSD